MIMNFAIRRFSIVSIIGCKDASKRRGAWTRECTWVYLSARREWRLLQAMSAEQCNHCLTRLSCECNVCTWCHQIRLDKRGNCIAIFLKHFVRKLNDQNLSKLKLLNFFALQRIFFPKLHSWNYKYKWWKIVSVINYSILATFCISPFPFSFAQPSHDRSIDIVHRYNRRTRYIAIFLDYFF